MSDKPAGFNSAISPDSHAGDGVLSTSNPADFKSVSTDTPVILLGDGVTAVAATRCLSRSGINVYCATTDDAYLRHCRWYQPVPGTSASLNCTKKLNDYLGGLTLEKAVLMPCSDDWVVAATEITDDLKGRFLTSLPSSEIARRLIDKMTLGGLLNELEIPHPRSIPITGENHLRRIFDEFKGTFFLKPRDSQRFHDCFGVKAFLVDNVDDAVEKFQVIRSAGLDVILQEYVPGPASNHRYMEGFADRHGDIQVWFARQRTRIFPPVFGNSSYMISVALPWNHHSFAFAAIRRLIKSTGFRGIFSAEFKRDERDWIYKLLEVNIRPWWYCEVPYRCGIDMITMAYHDALEHDLPWSTTYEVGRRFYSPYFDWSACRLAHRQGKLSLRQWAKDWWSAELIFFSWDDPMPTLHASTRLIKNKLRQLMGRGQRPKAEASKSG